MNFFYTFLSAAVVLTLTSCASRWTEETCSQTDFQQLGYNEGSQGKGSKIQSYNSACLKKKVNISLADYEAGHKKGLQAFCSPSKAQQSGTSGQSAAQVCLNIDHYMKSYEAGLKSFCSTKKGANDGFHMRPQNSLCTVYQSYRSGYAQGVKQFCSFERGQEHGFGGQQQHVKCSSYSNYVKGFKSGEKNYCSPENGYAMGKRGASFPSKCDKAGYSFKKKFQAGRVEYLQTDLREKESKLTFEKQNYEGLRDQIQDLQFQFQRLPKYSQNPEVNEQRKGIEEEISQLQSQRNAQRSAINTLEQNIGNIKAEISSLRAL